MSAVTPKKSSSIDDAAAANPQKKATLSPDAQYTFDDEALQKLRSDSPWMLSLPKVHSKSS